MQKVQLQKVGGMRDSVTSRTCLYGALLYWDHFRFIVVGLAHIPYPLNHVGTLHLSS